MKIRLFTLLTLFALIAAACADDTDETVTTGADETMEEETMEEEPEEAIEEEAMEEEPEEAMEEEPMEEELRIVSLSPTATEMVFAIGAGDLVVAVDAFSYYPEEAPVTELSGFEPNVEAIAGFEPTIVLSQSPIDGLDAIGIENMVLPAAANLDDIYAQIEQLGALTDNIGESAELVGQMQTDIDAVLAALPERETALTYYHELDPTLFSVTSGTFIGYVYELLGLENVADPADADGAAFGYPQLNEEFIVTADPDLIFIADTLCCAQTAATVAERPGWDALAAVQNGNVIEMNDDVVSRWGPRIVEFVETAGAAVAAIEAVPAA